MFQVHKRSLAQRRLSIYVNLLPNVLLNENPTEPNEADTSYSNILYASESEWQLAFLAFLLMVNKLEEIRETFDVDKFLVR